MECDEEKDSWQDNGDGKKNAWTRIHCISLCLVGLVAIRACLKNPVKIYPKFGLYPSIYMNLLDYRRKKNYENLFSFLFFPLIEFGPEMDWVDMDQANPVGFPKDALNSASAIPVNGQGSVQQLMLQKNMNQSFAQKIQLEPYEQEDGEAVARNSSPIWEQEMVAYFSNFPETQE